jgi:hypothetical protein
MLRLLDVGGDKMSYLDLPEHLRLIVELERDRLNNLGLTEAEMDYALEPMISYLLIYTENRKEEQNDNRN